MYYYKNQRYLDHLSIEFLYCVGSFNWERGNDDGERGQKGIKLGKEMSTA